jgi:hypothetical protein
MGRRNKSYYELQADGSYKVKEPMREEQQTTVPVPSVPPHVEEQISKDTVDWRKVCEDVCYRLRLGEVDQPLHMLEALLRK